MKVKFLATSKSPDKYCFDRGIVVAIHGGREEIINLEHVIKGDKFVQFIPDSFNLSGSQIIRDAYIENDELHLILCQKTPVTKVTYFNNGQSKTLTPDKKPPKVYDKKVEHRGAHWRESDWIDVSNYLPDKLYVKRKKFE